MTHKHDPRHVADLLVAMRRTLIRKTIAEAADDHIAVARQNGILDRLATGLPIGLRSEHALRHKVGDPARQIIDRYGILTLRDTNGYRPC